MLLCFEHLGNKTIELMWMMLHSRLIVNKKSIFICLLQNNCYILALFYNKVIFSGNTDIALRIQKLKSKQGNNLLLI